MTAIDTSRVVQGHVACGSQSVRPWCEVDREPNTRRQRDIQTDGLRHRLVDDGGCIKSTTVCHSMQIRRLQSVQVSPSNETSDYDLDPELGASKPGGSGVARSQRLGVKLGGPPAGSWSGAPVGTPRS